MKIKYLPCQPHSMAFGGFEIQILGIFNACKLAGADVEKMDIWSRDNDYEILHCWGMDLYNYNTILWAKKSGKKVVLTALLSYYETFESVLKHYLSLYVTRVGKYFYSIVHNSDVIVVVNNMQANVLIKYFNIPKSKIRIIPHLVDEIFYNSDQITEDSNLPFEKNSYLLTSGNVCQRKNQLTLAKAALATNSNLLILGKKLEGENEYSENIEELIRISNNKIIWVKGLEENSNSLINIYKNCLAYCLPSFMEMQPISALEAAILNKPILLGKHPYALQKYYQNAFLSDPKSVRSVVEGIKSIKENPSKYIVPKVHLEECKASNIGKAYSKVYEELMN